jgi:hypothetical protein
VLSHPFALPDRHRKDTEAAVFDPAALEELKRFPYSDSEIRDAAHAVVRDGPALFYAPTADWSSVDRLTLLCNLPPR